MSAAFHFQGDFSSRDAETALLWQAGCRGIEEKGGELIAYFDAPVALPLAGRWLKLDEVDWLATYYAGLKPVRVGRLTVSPTHHRPEVASGEHVLWLDPGMAFGTGHHVTTRLALGALQSLDLSGKRVLDVGAGSGILAIAADLLGAACALGIDIDPATVPVARQNAVLNGSQAVFKEGVLDEAVAAGTCDVLVANLYAELHAQLASGYARAVKPGGIVLLTGILEDRLEPLLGALEAHFAKVQTSLEDGWALLRARA